jgi:hypothetical protein
MNINLNDKIKDQLTVYNDVSERLKQFLMI